MKIHDTIRSLLSRSYWLKVRQMASNHKGKGAKLDYLNPRPRCSILLEINGLAMNFNTDHYWKGKRDEVKCIQWFATVFNGPSMDRTINTDQKMTVFVKVLIIRWASAWFISDSWCRSCREEYRLSRLAEVQFIFEKLPIAQSGANHLYRTSRYCQYIYSCVQSGLWVTRGWVEWPQQTLCFNI